MSCTKVAPHSSRLNNAQSRNQLFSPHSDMGSLTSGTAEMRRTASRTKIGATQVKSKVDSFWKKRELSSFINSRDELVQKLRASVTPQRTERADQARTPNEVETSVAVITKEA